MAMKYKIQVNTNTFDEVQEVLNWCKDHFGPKSIKGKKRNRNRWAASASGFTTTFSFKDKKQAEFFALRWV